MQMSSIHVSGLLVCVIRMACITGVLKRQLAEEEKLVLVSCIQSLFVLCGRYVVSQCVLLHEAFS